MNIQLSTDNTSIELTSDITQGLVDGTFTTAILNSGINCCDQYNKEVTITKDDICNPSIKIDNIEILDADNGNGTQNIRITVSYSTAVSPLAYITVGSQETGFTLFSNPYTITALVVPLDNTVVEQKLSVNFPNECAYEVMYNTTTGDFTPITSDVPTLILDETHFETSTLVDGVYYFKLSAQNNNVKIEEQQCKLIDINVTCKVIEHLAKNDNTNVHLLLNVLKEGDKCDCICEYMCIVYAKLLSELEDSSAEDLLKDCKCQS